MPDYYDLRRIPLRDPVPVYPHSLVWHRDNPHPALAGLRRHLSARSAVLIRADAGRSTPRWGAREA